MTLLRWCVLAAISIPLFGCVSGVAAGVVGAAVVVGFATRSCYDHVQITVFDGTGHRTCKAKVEVGSGDDFTTLESCYYAQLTEGDHVIQASLPGHVTETQQVRVAPRKKCTGTVHTMEITLKSLAPQPSPLLPAPLAPAPPATSPSPPAAPAPVVSPPAAPPAPATPPSVAAPPAPAAPPHRRLRLPPRRPRQRP